MTLPAIAAVGTLLGHQSRSGVAAAPPRIDTSTAAIVNARDRKTARIARKNAEQERILALISDPQVMGLITVFGGLAAANMIPWSADPGKRNALAGIAAMSAVLMGLGRAGVGDLTTMVVAGGAGAASALGGSGIGGSDSLPLTVNLPGTDYPIASAWGPLAPLRWLWQKVT